MDNRLHKVRISHYIMVYGESPEHCEKITRLHLKDEEADWKLVYEIADCATVEGHQTIVTSEDGLAQGYKDFIPYSDSDESRTCGEILKDETDARAAKPKED